jgi:hypothetical protein
VLSAQGNVVHVNFVAATTDDAQGEAEADVGGIVYFSQAKAIIDHQAQASADLEISSGARAVVETLATGAEVYINAA